MISKLEIKNYRNLKHLTLDGLKRVNLITGKNNSGKTSLLESISAWAVRGRFRRLLEIMFDRRELYHVKGGLSGIPIMRTNGNFFPSLTGNKGYSDIQNAIEHYAFLFNGRNIDFEGKNSIILKGDEEEVEIRFVKYRFDNDTRKKIEIENHDQDFNLGCKLTYTYGALKRWLILSEDVVTLRRQPSYPVWLPQGETFQFVNPAGVIDSEILREQFSKVTLTEKEDQLINGLRIIDDTIDRVGFSGDRNDNRVLLKMRGQKSPIPLNSMGFGMSRILATISACLNADKGFLLIDEFENGLHWTIQKRLWEIIFEVSNIHNVQVFATTHSEDAIQAFAEAALAKWPNESAYFRLDGSGEEISAIYYDTKELLFATENQIETRGL